MTRVFVLGHRGMLGNTVVNYFLRLSDKYELQTTDARWGEPSFKEVLSTTEADFIVNCIGAIPQKYAKQPEKYKELNIDLPIFLETLGRHVIHPSTDCEFSGTLPVGQTYTKTSIRDAVDDYGKSKATISEKIENEFRNTKIIRVSIVGHEIDTHNSLLEWTLSEHTEPIKGYSDHYWNGITTLAWCDLCRKLMEQWEIMPTLNQFGTEDYLSKYDLIKIMLDAYDRHTVVNKFETGTPVNKCLASDALLPDIKTQLETLRAYDRK